MVGILVRGAGRSRYASLGVATTRGVDGIDWQDRELKVTKRRGVSDTHIEDITRSHGAMGTSQAHVRAEAVYLRTLWI